MTALENKNRKLLLIACWVGLAGMVLGADYLSGPRIRFPIAFLMPVVLGAWYNGQIWGFVFAAGLPCLRLSFLLPWNASSSLAFEGINAAIQIVVLTALVFFADRTATLLREVKTLRGIIPMCCFCRKIRNEKEQWIPLESYISDHSEAKVSHGLCPSCYKKYYGKYYSQVDGT